MPTIIIADDHPITVMGTRAFVESLGYKLLDTCSNGIAAYNRHCGPATRSGTYRYEHAGYEWH